MQNAKEQPNRTCKKKTGWLDFIHDDHDKLVVPVGPRFQVDVPDWTDPQNDDRCKYKDRDSDTLKWLGSVVWPAEDNLRNKDVNMVEDRQTKEELIGKGRNVYCSCQSPESVECVKRHVKEERLKLKFELRKAFSIWKFDEMGEEGSNLWNLNERKTFSFLVKANRMSQGKSFLKPAIAAFSSKTRQKIINYYFNVHVPQRIALQTRSGCKIIDTDDEEGDEEVPITTGSRKRKGGKTGAPSSSKPAKRKYLTGRR